MTILSDMVKLKKAKNGHFLVFSEKKRLLNLEKVQTCVKKPGESNRDVFRALGGSI